MRWANLAPYVAPGSASTTSTLLLARGERPYEVPISYRARSREEGKKLTWGDGIDATWILLRVRARHALMNRLARRRGPRPGRLPSPRVPAPATPRIPQHPALAAPAAPATSKE
jgi:hypothetical protein